MALIVRDSEEAKRSLLKQREKTPTLDVVVKQTTKIPTITAETESNLLTAIKKAEAKSLKERFSSLNDILKSAESKKILN